MKMMKIISFVLLLTVALQAQGFQESNDFSYALKLYNEGFYDISVQQFSVFMGKYPRSERLPDAQYYKGMALFQLKDFENARIEFQSLAVGYPEHQRAPEAWQKVGECYLKLNKPEEAAKALETVKVLFPDHPAAPVALLQTAEIYYQTNKDDKCLLTLKDLIDRYPDSGVYPKARLLLAELHLKMGRFEQSRKEYEKVIEIQADPEITARAKLGLANYSRQIGQFDKAEKIYLQVINENANTEYFSLAVKELIQQYIFTREFDQALLNLNKYRGRVPQKKDRQKLDLLKASVHILKDENFATRKVLSEMEYALLPDMEKQQWLYYRALVAEAEQQPGEALKHLEELLNTETEKTKSDYLFTGWLKYVDLLYRQGRFNEAEEALVKLSEEEPELLKSKSIWQKRIKGAILAEKYEKAANLLDEWQKNSREVVGIDEAYFLLAKKLFQSGRYPESAKLFELIENQFPGTAKYDSVRLYSWGIKNIHTVSQSVGIRKLAALIGQLLTESDKRKLKLDLAEIYLSQLKDPEQAIQLCESLIKEGEGDPEILAQANWIKSRAEYIRFMDIKLKNGPSPADQRALTNALKRSMEFAQYLPERDSLAYLFLSISINDGKNAPADLERKIGLWSHFAKTATNNKLVGKAMWKMAEMNLQLGDTLAALFLLDSLSQITDRQLQGTAVYRVGDLLLSQGKIEPGVNKLKDFLLNWPAHFMAPAAYDKLGKIAIQQGDFTSASQYFQRVLDQFPYTTFAEHAKKEIPLLYLAAGEIQRAISMSGRMLDERENFDPVISQAEDYSNRAVYLFVNGKAHFLNGENELARKRLVSYLFTPNAQEYRNEAFLLLAKISVAEGDPESALLHLANIDYRRTDKVAVQGREMMAELYYKQGQYAKAAENYLALSGMVENVEKQAGYKIKNLICLNYQGMTTKYENGLKEFQKEYKKLSNFKDLMAEAYFEEGKRYFSNKKFDPAIKKFKTVIKKYKESAFEDDAYYYLGLTYSTLNKTEEALKYLAGFSDNYPNSDLVPNVYISLGGLYYRAEEAENAVGAFKKAVETAHKPEVKKIAMGNLIKLYFDLGLWDGLLAQCREYVKLFPHAQDVLDKKILIGQALGQLNRYSEAIEYLKQIKLEASSEQEPEIQFYIGEAYFNAGQYQNAIREFVKIPLLSKQTRLQWEASALYFSGQAYEKLGRVDDAIRMYQEIVDRPGIIADLKREAKKRINQLKKQG
ncbi:MAG: hypothetical protein Kow0037_09130 [Calditrichia bacterium]